MKRDVTKNTKDYSLWCSTSAMTITFYKTNNYACIPHAHQIPSNQVPSWPHCSSPPPPPSPTSPTPTSTPRAPQRPPRSPSPLHHPPLPSPPPLHHWTLVSSSSSLSHYFIKKNKQTNKKQTTTTTKTDVNVMVLAITHVRRQLYQPLSWRECENLFLRSKC